MLEKYLLALITLTLFPLVATFVISKVPLQIVWCQIAPDKLFDAGGILRRIFFFFFFFEDFFFKSANNKNNMEKYSRYKIAGLQIRKSEYDQEIPQSHTSDQPIAP